MATAPAAEQEGSTWSHIITAGSLPDTLRKRGIDNAGSMVYVTRQWTPFTWFLHNHLGKATKMVKDRVYQTREVTELDWYYKVVIGSGVGADSGVEKVICISNKQAHELHANDVLYIKGLYTQVVTQNLVAGQVYAASGGVQGTNIGPDLNWSTGGNPTSIVWNKTPGVNPAGIYFVDPEQVKVHSIGEKDSGGTGLTQVILNRCYMGPSAFDEGGKMLSPSFINTQIAAEVAANAAAPVSRIYAEDILLRGAPAYMEGTNYPSGVYKNPVSDNNFTQLYKYAVEMTEESEIPELFIKERPLDINRWMCLLRANRDREFSNLLGRKGYARDTEGKEIYVMGGVREFIPKDSDHYFHFKPGTITYPDLIDLSVPLYNLCNSGKMWGVTGPSLCNAFTKSFFDSHLFFNKEESTKFQMKVNTLVIGEVEINLIASQIMELSGLGSELMLLDMSFGDSFTPVSHKGWDMRVEKDIAEKGSSIIKEGVKGMFGLERRRRNNHAIINFSNAVNVG